MADRSISLVKPLFPSVRWTSGTDDVWLTFDDGPHPVATPALLEVLRREQITAAFFMLGERAERYPDLVRAVRDEGHLIGNHADVHEPVWFRARKTVIGRLNRASDAIERAAGRRPTVFRPPYGRFDPSTPVHARAAGLTTMMFSVNSWDFAGGPASAVAERVLRRLRPGDIVLLHDNDRTAPFAGALASEIIKRGRDAGRHFGNPTA